MNQKISEIRTENWRKIVHECVNRDPNLTKKQWCQENGIKYRSFMYWQLRLQMEALDQIEGHGTALPIQSGAADVSPFTDMTSHLEALKAAQEPVLQEQEPLAPVPELMIQAGPYRIYVNSSIHESTLETVIKVLGHA